MTRDTSLRQDMHKICFVKALLGPATAPSVSLFWSTHLIRSWYGIMKELYLATAFELVAAAPTLHHNQFDMMIKYESCTFSLLNENRMNQFEVLFRIRRDTKLLLTYHSRWRAGNDAARVWNYQHLSLKASDTATLACINPLSQKWQCFNLSLTSTAQCFREKRQMRLDFQPRVCVEYAVESI